MFLWTLLLVLLLAAAAYVVGQRRAAGLVTAGGARLHSLPSYHGLLLGAGALLGGLALAIDLLDRVHSGRSTTMKAPATRRFSSSSRL